MGEAGRAFPRRPEFSGNRPERWVGIAGVAVLSAIAAAGFAITALVHTDMASVHVFNAGSKAQRERWMPDIVAGKVICAIAVTEPEAPAEAPAEKDAKPQKA